MKNLKILFLSQSAGYGVTIYIETLLTRLDRTKYKIVLLGSEYYNKPQYSKLVDKLYTIPMERGISVKDIYSIIDCKKIINRENPDIVYCHSAKAGIYGRLACWGTNTKVIYNPHGWAFNMKCNKMKQLFYKTVECCLAFITDRIICISNYEAQTAPSIIPKKKMVVIENGIDINKCNQSLSLNDVTREKLNIPIDAFVIGIVARISIQKGQDLFVKIAKEIKEKIPNSYFLIVGGKSDDIDIERQIDVAGLSNCFAITGEVEQAIRYASLFDVAVLTSRWEGFGLVLPEYMVAKKPIVAYNVDAIPEIIEDGVNGILVASGCISEFADAIYKIYSQPQFAQRLVENGENRVNAFFDISRVVYEHERLIVNICKSGG